MRPEEYRRLGVPGLIVAFALLLGVFGCVSTQASWKPGTPKPPSSIPWCRIGPAAIGDLPAEGLLLKKSPKRAQLVPYMQRCYRALTIADHEYDDTHHVFGLTTDPSGAVIRVCLVGTSSEPDGYFVACVADELERERPILEPNLDEVPLHVVMRQ